MNQFTQQIINEHLLCTVLGTEKTTKNKTIILSLIEFMFKCTMKALDSNSLLNPITVLFIAFNSKLAHLLKCLFSASPH